MRDNIFIMLFRHFKTSINLNGEEKINYSNSFQRAEIFVNQINDFIKKYPQIKKIKFFTSDKERTLVTSLVISSKIKSNIIEKKQKSIKIYDPLIEKNIDRDPKKIYKDKICNYFNDKINYSYEEDTLYIYITHSSVIHNLFKCMLEECTGKPVEDFKNKKIHGYSLSYIAKKNGKVTYEFNNKMD